MVHFVLERTEGRRQCSNFQSVSRWDGSDSYVSSWNGGSCLFVTLGYKGVCECLSGVATLKIRN